MDTKTAVRMLQGLSLTKEELQALFTMFNEAIDAAVRITPTPLDDFCWRIARPSVEKVEAKVVDYLAGIIQ